MQAGSVRSRRSNRGTRVVASLGVVVTCLAGNVAGGQAGPRTQAERTGYLETSSHESVLAMYLLEPESDDGLVAWDVAGRSSGAAGTAPVIRLATAPSVAMTPVR